MSMSLQKDLSNQKQVFVDLLYSYLFNLNVSGIDIFDSNRKILFSTVRFFSETDFKDYDKKLLHSLKNLHTNCFQKSDVR